LGGDFVRPENPTDLIITPGLKLNAREKAAFVIGHEIDGHLNHGLIGSTIDESLSNYYGLKAL